MQSKLESHAYRSVGDLEDDFNLMISNCLLYNTKDTVYHRTALRLRELGGAVLRHAQRQATNTGFDEDTGMLLPKSPQKRDFYGCTWEDGKRDRRHKLFMCVRCLHRFPIIQVIVIQEYTLCSSGFFSFFCCFWFVLLVSEQKRLSVCVSCGASLSACPIGLDSIQGTASVYRQTQHAAEI